MCACMRVRVGVRLGTASKRCRRTSVQPRRASRMGGRTAQCDPSKYSAVLRASPAPGQAVTLQREAAASAAIGLSCPNCAVLPAERADVSMRMCMRACVCVHACDCVSCVCARVHARTCTCKCSARASTLCMRNHRSDRMRAVSLWSHCAAKHRQRHDRRRRQGCRATQQSRKPTSPCTFRRPLAMQRRCRRCTACDRGHGIGAGRRVS
jgi:hypothetical protein